MFQTGYSKTQRKMSGIKDFFLIKAVLISQSIKQFTEQLYIIILLLNKCSFVTNSYKAINIKFY